MVEHPLDVENQKTSGRRRGALRDFMLREELTSLLSVCLTLNALLPKSGGTANAKDLRAVASTIGVIPEIKKLIAGAVSEEISGIYAELETLEDIYSKIDSAIKEDPPFSVREGDIIRDGYDEDVDYLRSVMHDGKGFIEKITAEEREKTGIKNLKIAQNKVFGYYIEVTNSYLSQVPDRYIRKQTLSNCERYITQELKEKEAMILGAADKVCSLEYEIFCRIRNFVAENSTRIQKAAALIARLDVFLSLASVAVKNKYIRPYVDKSDKIEIKDGRHPVVELFVKDVYFVPNDVYLDTERNRLMLITGPNMAGNQPMAGCSYRNHGANRPSFPRARRI